MKHVLKVYRAERYSPNSEERDRAILDAVGRIMARQGLNVTGTDEDMLTADTPADIIISMARSAEALTALDAIGRRGATVVNSPDSVRACRRSTADRLMRANDLPAAPLSGTDGYWIKRGDEAAQQRDDILFAKNEEEKEQAIAHLKARGISDIVVTAHVNGDLVKFYGVAGTGFFRTFRHSDGDYSKFGDEAVNGRQHSYGFSTADVHAAANRLAELTGTDVYGGDCIIRKDGTFAIIDFNDWPSFAKCRDEAAEAIAEAVTAKARLKTIKR